MKKLFTLLSIILLIANLSTAQIRKSVLGLTLGVSNKTAVAKILKSKHVKFWEQDGSLVANHIQFGGFKWSAVFFEFYNNKLYSVAFRDDSINKDSELLLTVFKRLGNDLYRKYSSYYDSEESYDGNIIFSDKNVELILEGGYYNGIFNLAIMYTYLPILYKKIESEGNEL